MWLPSIGGDSFLSDDIDHLTAWGIPPFAQVWQWFYSEYFHYYRPLTALLWKTEFAVWGLAPFGYQLVNLMMHTACAMLVREVAQTLCSDNNRIGLWSALVFLFLPGHIFGVLMVSALTGLLCTLCYLAAGVCYLRSRSSKANWAHLMGPAFFLLALMTKELALSFPLLIGFWEAIALRSAGRFGVGRWFKACLPYGLITILYLLFRYALFGQMPYSPLHANPTPLRLTVNAATYAAKCLAPWGLENLKPFFRAHPLLLMLTAVVGFGGSLGALWRWHRALTAIPLFGLVWFSISVLPVISLYSPWNTYLPSAGTALMLGALFDYTTRLGLPRRSRQVALAIFLILSAIYSLSHQRQWLQARTLCAELTAAAATLNSSGQVYLANLPAEWNEVPLFIGDWALRGTLAFRSQSSEITALANVIKTQREENLEIKRSGETAFSLRLLTAGDFFRLESMEILAGTHPLGIGYTYSKGGCQIRVASLDGQGQANGLLIDMGSQAELARVHLWDGQQLTRLLEQ